MDYDKGAAVGPIVWKHVSVKLSILAWPIDPGFSPVLTPSSVIPHRAQCYFWLNTTRRFASFSRHCLVQSQCFHHAKHFYQRHFKASSFMKTTRPQLLNNPLITITVEILARLTCNASKFTPAQEYTTHVTLILVDFHATESLTEYLPPSWVSNNSWLIPECSHLPPATRSMPATRQARYRVPPRGGLQADLDLKRSPLRL
ncbi:hypothetical protein RRG08_036470 [Elysia crispata]|uniref:Uncharacterized protein n=1 Tax=Elysia crispata TaxID=231223 RepID=A0AAE0ZK79_9GAST|nr:hypothetical protein RRG08_036470 [Elysia crispata]